MSLRRQIIANVAVLIKNTQGGGSAAQKLQNKYVLHLLLRKLLQGLILVLVTSAVTFALLSNAGGDALTSLRDNPQVSAHTIEELRRVYGLDQSVYVRYATWLGGAVRADLGESFYYKTPVGGLVFSRFLSTAGISVVAILIAALISFLFSFLQIRSGWRPLTKIIDAIVLLSASTPRLVLSLIGLSLAVSFALRSTFVLAAIAMAIPLVAALLAQFHESLSQAMKLDFVRTARAKGLGETAIILRHAIRAAIGPVVTILGLSFGALLGGSVVVETILGRPGIGSLTVLAVRNRDIPLLMGIMLIASAAVWAGNTVAEFIQLLNDKRLTAAEKR